MNKIMSLVVTIAGSACALSALAGTTDEGRPVQTWQPITAQANPLQQQCWLDHAQVQPSPVPIAATAGNLASGGLRVWNPPGGRPGSEHWNVADLQRACREQLTRRLSVSGLVADFLSSP